MKELDIAWHKANDDVCRLEVELKDLEEFNLIHKEENKLLQDELAALKQSQGETYGWYDTECGQMFFDRHERKPETEIPLYTTPIIPEGWQLVPVEPTEEMCAAGLEVNAFGRDRAERPVRRIISITFSCTF